MSSINKKYTHSDTSIIFILFGFFPGPLYAILLFHSIHTLRFIPIKIKSMCVYSVCVKETCYIVLFDSI